jgi:ABC-type transport system involved in cytochrome c biogenesis permease subunit
MKRTLLTLSLLALSAPVLAGGPELEPLREIAIQEGGRTKPLDSFARELARRIQGARAFGLESIAGLEPTEWLLSTLATPDRWKAEPIVKVTHAGLRDAAGLPHDKDRYSFQELAGHQGLQGAVARARVKVDRDEDLDPVDREVLNLYDTLLTYQGVMSGESLHVVPHPDDPKASWYSIADLASPQATAIPQVQRVRALVSALVAAYGDGDRAGVQTAASALRSRLAELAPAIYPSGGQLTTEVHYNRLKPFRTAWVLYLLGFLSLLASFPLASRAFSGAGFALVAAGFVSQAHGMLLRILISGRPPVTNMYESVVWVAFGAVLFAFVFEAIYRVRIFAACASALAVLCLILADNVPILDGSIAPLVPVLRDNMWLTVHVLTITLGYAAFTLAMGIGHLNLGLYFFRPREVVLFKTLSLFLYRALQVGTLFLAVGTLLGGVWASYSWGRFWGWDPKETWALIATLGYLAILHARMTGWIKGFGMAVGSLVGYLLVLMAWYGVNFVLGTGLHSYGFGSGGYWYVGGFVAFEVLVITAALLRRRSELQKLAPPAAAPAPAH